MAQDQNFGGRRYELYCASPSLNFGEWRSWLCSAMGRSPRCCFRQGKRQPRAGMDLVLTSLLIGGEWCLFPAKEICADSKQLGARRHAWSLRRWRLRSLSQPSHHILQLPLPPTTMAAVSGILPCSNAWGVRWIRHRVRELHQCYRLLRRRPENCATRRKSYSRDLLHISATIPDQSEPILL